MLRPWRIAVAPLLTAAVFGAPIEAQTPSSGGEASRVMLGAAAGPGMGGLLAGILSTQSLAVDVAGLVGARIRPGMTVVAEAGMLPTSLESPFDDRDLRLWRVMLGVQQSTGGWFRPSVGWEQGTWDEAEDGEPAEVRDDSTGGPVIGIAFGSLFHELGGRWGLGAEVFGRWAWLDTDPSSNLRVFGLRGVLMRR